MAKRFFRKGALVAALLCSMGALHAARANATGANSSAQQAEQTESTSSSEPDGECPRSEFVVYFEWDRSNLNQAAIETIDAAIARAAGCDVARVVVTGHSDTSGSPTYNAALSERRASVVSDALVSRRIPAGAIYADGRGETDLARATRDGVREPLNRRTAITITFGSAAYIQLPVVSANAARYYSIRNEHWVRSGTSEVERQAAMLSTSSFGPYEIGDSTRFRVGSQYHIVPVCGETVTWARAIRPVIAATTNELRVQC
jgi:outer membrane protein OmpA-like peptidoglycan-associated protein